MNSLLKIKTMVVGMIQACCYIVHTPPSKNALIIDPGGDGDEIIRYLGKSGLTPIYIVNTHGHIDHIGANTELKKAFPKALLCIHQADAPMLTAANRNLSIELGYSFVSPEADKFLNEGDIISLSVPTADPPKAWDEAEFKVLHTPGHTPGGISLLYQDPKDTTPIIFTGDTLFQMGVGRTDFPGSSMQQLLESIRTKILTLQPETIVYPGHGPATTVGAEKEMNPFLMG